MPNLIKTIAVLLAVTAIQAHALQITSLTPQGKVSRIPQVVAKFDAAIVNFGDPKAPVPLARVAAMRKPRRARGAGSVTANGRLGLKKICRRV